MKNLSYAIAAVFAVSLISLATSTPASAEGNCSYGHSKTTAQSSQQQVAQTKPLQTPKPSGS